MRWGALALPISRPTGNPRRARGTIGEVATAFTTVVREIANRSAIPFFGTPSAASLRINAQSSKVITLQSLSVHFSSVATDQISKVLDIIDCAELRQVAEDASVIWKKTTALRAQRRRTKSYWPHETVERS